MYVVYINLLYFLSIFLFTYNKNLLSQKNLVFGSSLFDHYFSTVKCAEMSGCNRY